MKNKINRICLQCGKEFDSWLSQVNHRGAKYCSRECYDLHRYRMIENTCIVCSSTFLRRKSQLYCSPHCVHIHNHEQNSKIITCKSCGKEFTDVKSSKAKYCSKQCVFAGCRPQEYSNDFAKARIRIIESFDEKCFLCGKQANTVHHIDYDKSNSKDYNLVLLCTSCHSKTNPLSARWFYKGFFINSLWE